MSSTSASQLIKDVTHLEGPQIVYEDVGYPEVLDQVQVHSREGVRGDGTVQSNIAITLFGVHVWK